jgi:predicted DNA-binding transcriptional regulator AlpA
MTAVKTDNIHGDIGAGFEAGAETTTSAQAPPIYIQPNFDRLPPELKSLKNWLISALVQNGAKWAKRSLTGISTPTLYRKISANEFPRLVPAGTAARAWPLSESQNWMAGRIELRGRDNG